MDNIKDFIDFYAEKAGMTREEYTAYYLSENKETNEGLPYDAFDKKPKTKEIDPEDLTYPLETAMGRVNIETLDDITTIKQFKDLVKAMKKTGEVPAEFFALKVEDQMGIIGQAVMYI